MNFQDAHTSLLSGEAAQWLQTMASDKGETTNRLLHQLVRRAWLEHQRQELDIRVKSGEVEDSSSIQLLVSLSKTMDAWLDAQCGMGNKSRKKAG